MLADWRASGIRWLRRRRLPCFERRAAKQIVEIQLAGLRKRLAERNISVDLTDAARTRLVREGYDPVYGAQPLKRAIQREVATPLAKRILSGDVWDGYNVWLDADREGSGLKFEVSADKKRAAAGV